MKPPTIIDCDTRCEAARVLGALLEQSICSALARTERLCLAFSPALLAAGLLDLRRASPYQGEAPARPVLVTTETLWDPRRHARAFGLRCQVRSAGLDPATLIQVPAGERDAGLAALRFEQSLRGAFSLRNGELPRFGLVALDRGEAAAAGVLRRCGAALPDLVRLAVVGYDAASALTHVSLTPPVICEAARVVIVTADPAGTVDIPACLDGPGIERLTVLRMRRHADAG